FVSKRPAQTDTGLVQQTANSKTPLRQNDRVLADPAAPSALNEMRSPARLPRDASATTPARRPAVTRSQATRRRARLTALSRPCPLIATCRTIVPAPAKIAGRPYAKTLCQTSPTLKKNRC